MKSGLVASLALAALLATVLPSPAQTPAIFLSSAIRWSFFMLADRRRRASIQLELRPCAPSGLPPAAVAGR